MRYPVESEMEIAMDIKLNATEIRVLGCLIEKEIATPDYYPLTLNALVNACNQKSNRNPVMMLDEDTVMRTLDELRMRYSVMKMQWHQLHLRRLRQKLEQ